MTHELFLCDSQIAEAATQKVAALSVERIEELDRWLRAHHPESLAQSLWRLTRAVAEVLGRLLLQGGLATTEGQVGGGSIKRPGNAELQLPLLATADLLRAVESFLVDAEGTLPPPPLQPSDPPPPPPLGKVQRPPAEFESWEATGALGRLHQSALRGPLPHLLEDKLSVEAGADAAFGVFPIRPDQAAAPGGPGPMYLSQLLKGSPDHIRWAEDLRSGLVAFRHVTLRNRGPRCEPTPSKAVAGFRTANPHCCDAGLCCWWTWPYIRGSRLRGLLSPTNSTSACGEGQG